MGEEMKTPLLFNVPRVTHCHITYSLLKVAQAELFGLWEEFSLMHEASVENDVGAFCNFNAVNVIILQSSSHREINHGMKPQRLVDETLQHSQVLTFNVFWTLFT